MSTTPPITTEVWAFCKTNFGRRSRPRPPILSLEQPRKGAKAPHTPWDPWGRQNYCKPKQHYLVLAASGASDQDLLSVYRCSFSWRFQWHHRRPWPTSAAGDIVDLSPSTFSYPWHLHLHGVLVLVIGDKFIAGVVDTADNWSPVSTKNLSPVSTTPTITENPWQGLIAGVTTPAINFSPVS